MADQGTRSRTNNNKKAIIGAGLAAAAGTAAFLLARRTGSAGAGAELDDTKIGQAKKDDPADVAKAGWTRCSEVSRQSFTG